MIPSIFFLNLFYLSIDKHLGICSPEIITFTKDKFPWRLFCFICKTTKKGIIQKQNIFMNVRRNSIKHGKINFIVIVWCYSSKMPWIPLTFCQRKFYLFDDFFHEHLLEIWTWFFLNVIIISTVKSFLFHLSQNFDLKSHKFEAL